MQQITVRHKTFKCADTSSFHKVMGQNKDESVNMPYLPLCPRSVNSCTADVHFPQVLLE